LIQGYTAKFNIDKLVFYQEFTDVRDAIAAERKMKGWVRKKKDGIITEFNPEWKDLSEGWF
jgi:putative endonuclease